jgi:hypothetical protein
MNTKKRAQSGFLDSRALIILLLCAVTSSIVGGTLGFFCPETQASVSHPAAAGLTFAERVAYQRAIEEVYWRHRIWPKDNPDPKPSLDAVMSQVQLEKKVADYLCNSQGLEDYWQQPITAQQLQAEVDRMAQHTRQPEVLRELFEALGNDPFVIAECLARPVLAERMLPKRSGGSVAPWTMAAHAEGQEFLIASRLDSGSALLDPPYLNTGGRYNPSTDSWTPTTTNSAPTGRYGHTAI